jgi:hypothetical protein
MIEPTRILMLGDTHGNGPWTRWAIQYAAENGCDAIVQVGDFGHGWDAGQFYGEVHRALVKYGITLYWVDGNHENHDDLTECLQGSREPTATHARYPNIIHLPRGFRWEWWGQVWMSLGGAASVDRLSRKAGGDWWPGELLTDEDIAYASRPGRVDVIVSHDTPFGVDIPGIGTGSTPNTGSGFPLICLQESSEHRRRVRDVVDAVRPKLIVHGHYHKHYQAFYELPGGERTLVQGLDCDGTPLQLSSLLINKP